jgi:uncharacterized protein YgiM (DUF1202 family)
VDGRDVHGGGLLVQAVRVVVPWVALALIVVVVWSWFGAYRDARDGGSAPAGDTSGTVIPTSTPEAGGTSDQAPDPAPSDSAGSGAAIAPPYVVVLAEGLNLRTDPMTSSTVIKKLTEGQRLTLIEKGEGWYRVSDGTGNEGWVAAGGRYTELVE